MAFCILKEVARAKCALTDGSSNLVHNVTVAAADDSAHVLSLTTATLMGQATCVGVAKRACIRSSRVIGSGPLRAQRRDLAEAESELDLEIMEPLGAALL